MDIKRTQHRIVVDIAITVTTVLDSLEARIIDLSDHGAQIRGASMPVGTKFQIEYAGQTVYAQCMWSEIDRMGVRFPFDLNDGPLHDRLVMASAPSGVTAPDEQPFPGYADSVSRRSSTTFGRRNSA